MSEINFELSVPELKGVEKSEAAQIRRTFEPMAKMLEGFEAAYNEIMAEAEKGITPELSARAKRLRLDISRVRIDTGKAKDKEKEDIKRKDRAIMGVHNILVWAIKGREDGLKKIEDDHLIQEQKRLDKLQSERATALSAYVEDADERRLGDMEEDVWMLYFEGKKKEFEDRVKAEEQAEKDRIAKIEADKKEQDRIKAEHAQLKKEIEARDRQSKLEAKHRAKIEAVQKAERDELAAKLKEKEDAERELREAEEERKRVEQSKDDDAKVALLVADLKELKLKYVFTSDKKKKMHSDFCALIDKVIIHIQK